MKENVIYLCTVIPRSLHLWGATVKPIKITLLKTTLL